MTRAVSAYSLAHWDGIPAGTLVTLRRGALTGEREERTKAWTAGGPYVSESGIACIRVDIDGAIVSYPLARVSLGWEEARSAAVVRLAAALDPPPMLETREDRFVSLALWAALLYFVAIGGLSIAGYLMRLVDVGAVR